MLNGIGNKEKSRRATQNRIANGIKTIEGLQVVVVVEDLVLYTMDLLLYFKLYCSIKIITLAKCNFTVNNSQFFYLIVHIMPYLFICLKNKHARWHV